MPKLKNSAVSAIVVSGERAARNFDHRADLILDLLSGRLLHFGCDAIDDLHLQIQLRLEPDQRDHHFGLDLDPFLLHLRRRLENRAGLHLGDDGILDAQTATAEAEHRVELVKLMNALGHHLPAIRRASSATSTLLRLIVRQELVQRRIEQADARGQSIERPENSFEIALLIRQHLLDRLSDDPRRSWPESSPAPR